MEEKEVTTIYKVVVNHEEQYSIYPAEKSNPPGWNDVAKPDQSLSASLISRKYGLI